MRTWALGVGAAAAVAAAGYRAQALSHSGAVAATAVGGVTFAVGGLPASASLIVFFATSSALSRWKQQEKHRRGVIAQEKGGRRDAWQVLANGGAATAALLLGSPAGFVGSLATAAADTWATELGLLARQPPRHVLTGETVAPGTSGGVTAVGLAASLAGAMMVGATYAALARQPARWALAATLAGACGALLDSLLGATIQARYTCAVCGAQVEAPQHSGCVALAEHVGGWRFVRNDAVNGLSTAAGAVLGALLAR